MTSESNVGSSSLTDGSTNGISDSTRRYDIDPVETITFVGGGDAGLMAALILKAMNPGVEIAVIDDFSDDIPEVGKSTISYILHTFHEVLDIDKQRFIREVKPIWKASVYFTDWCGCDPFHVPFDGFTILPSDDGDRKFEEFYHRYQSKNYHTIGCEIAEQQVTPLVELKNTGNFTAYDHIAYHLSTNRLNQFLRELCAERDIDLIDDRITDVETDGNQITGIVSEETRYASDLFVDATGFERLLMSELDNGFISFDFPLDSALVAQTDISLAEIVPATVINSGEFGWFWQIDTFDCRDLGYVYSSSHVSQEDAVREFIAERDGEIAEEDIQPYSFQAGSLERAWVGNCVAVGNALGFVEPLQSTAVTTNAQLAEKLGELLSDHYHLNHRGIQNIYNGFAESIWQNVYDFVSIHYRFAPASNEFWREMRSVNDPENIRKYVGTFRENGFTSYNEFGGYSGPTLTIFNQYLFYRVLRSMNVESDFYESVNVEVSPEVERSVNQKVLDIRNSVENHLSYEEVYSHDVFK